MRRLIAFVLTAITAFLAIGYTIPMTTVAQPDEDEFSARLTELNGSGTSGTATVELDDGQATVVLNVSGASAGLPHAQHIHIVAEGESVCPGPEAADDRVDDGFIDTVEGLPAYGAIRISLTTEGDVTDHSGLAVARFPVANANGSYTYVRTFDLPHGVDASDIARGEIVVHGISELFDDPSAYDGVPRSSLTDTLPLEATIPAACGALFGEEELEDTEDQREEDAEATQEAIEEQQEQDEEDAEATQEALEEQEEADADATEAAREQDEDDAEATREANAEATETAQEQAEADAEATEEAEEQAEEDAEATREANAEATEAAQEREED